MTLKEMIADIEKFITEHPDVDLGELQVFMTDGQGNSFDYDGMGLGTVNEWMDGDILDSGLENGDNYIRL